MTRPAAEHPEAGAELLAAAEFYESLVPGLGHEFMARVGEAVRDVVDRPESWPPVFGGRLGAAVRSRATRSFPYRVVFIHHHAEIVILAYAHDRQRPGYWRARAPGDSRE